MKPKKATKDLLDFYQNSKRFDLIELHMAKMSGKNFRKKFGKNQILVTKSNFL